MFKILFKSILICCVFSICQISQAFALHEQIRSRANEIECAPQLRNCLATLQKLPEVKDLITAIQQEGSIRLALNKSKLSEQFGAFWDVDRRIIFVNLSWHQKEGELLASILFELHNASINSKINQLDHLASTGKIERDKYVEAMEFLEYQNAVKASALLKKGVELKIFPPSAYLPLYSSFEEHFRMQKIGGHSAWFAHNYDNLAPKKGHFQKL